MFTPGVLGHWLVFRDEIPGSTPFLPISALAGNEWLARVPFAVVETSRASVRWNQRRFLHQILTVGTTKECEDAG